MRISDWSSDVCSSDLGPLSAWRKAASSRVKRHVTLKRPSRGRWYPPDSPAWTEPAKGAPMSDDIYDDDDGHEAAPMEMLASYFAAPDWPHEMVGTDETFESALGSCTTYERRAAWGSADGVNPHLALPATRAVGVYWGTDGSEE